MGKVLPEAAKSGRKRQLNVIYFIDSARTRNLVLSMPQLRWLGGAFAALITWSLASCFIVAWLVQGRADLMQHLHAALGAIFEFETRDERVYDIAYPPSNKSAEQVLAQVTPPPKAAPAAPAAALAAQDEELAHLGSGEDESEGSAKTTLLAPQPSLTDKNAEGHVSIGHPTVEMHASRLELRFDLTSHSATGLVDGYIYAVAEFTTDTGERLYIGAPGEIQLSSDGVPSDTRKAASFAIRRHKQKIFTFPVVNNKAGIFTKVHIAVLDRSGGSRSSLDLPVQIRIGKSDGEGPGHNSAPNPKPG